MTAMRKVLLRFMFDNLWQWQPVGNELHVGAAWLILLWLGIVGIVFGVLYHQTKKLGESAVAAGFWLIIPAGLVALWFLKLPIARSGIPVFGYGLMMFFGFSSATWLASQRVRKIGHPPELIWDMMMWVLIPGLIGARMNYLLQYYDRVFAGKQGAQLILAVFALWDGGIVFYGSVIGGTIGALAFCRKRSINPVPILDVLAPSLLVGEGFGRIGCFLYGCCFGRVCNLPWAVRFPPDSLTFEKMVERGTIAPDAVATIALHPTQLYSSFAAFVLAGILAWYFRRRPFDGAVLALAFILYPINRFLLETLRDDEPGLLGTDLSLAQWLSIPLLISGIAAMCYFSQHRKLTTANVSTGDQS